MGFFSSIWSAIRSVFESVIKAISKVFNSVFGSPLVAALAMFVVAFITAGVGLTTLLANPTLLLTSGAFLAAATVNVILQLVILISPDFGQMIAKIFGVISFILMAIGGYVWVSDAAVNTGTWLYNTIGSFGLATAAELQKWVVFISMLSTLTTVSGAAAGPDSEYVKAWTEGFLAIPDKGVEIIDTVVDGVVSAATSSFVTLAVVGIGAYLGFKYLTRSDSEKIAHRREQTELIRAEKEYQRALKEGR